jgi:hypothetical protein
MWISVHVSPVSSIVLFETTLISMETGLVSYRVASLDEFTFVLAFHVHAHIVHAGVDIMSAYVLELTTDTIRGWRNARIPSRQNEQILPIIPRHVSSVHREQVNIIVVIPTVNNMMMRNMKISIDGLEVPAFCQSS